LDLGPDPLPQPAEADHAATNFNASLVELLGAQVVGLVAEKPGQGGTLGKVEVSRVLFVLDRHLAIGLPLQVPGRTVLEVREPILLLHRLLPCCWQSRDESSQTLDSTLVLRALDAELTTFQPCPLLLECLDGWIWWQECPNVVGDHIAAGMRVSTVADMRQHVEHRGLGGLAQHCALHV
jgi:hypothetical protein